MRPSMIGKSPVFTPFAVVRSTPSVIIRDIKKVHFSGDRTIVIFRDGSKVMCRCRDMDEFDPEVGFAMCMMKRLFGSRTKFKKFMENILIDENNRREECQSSQEKSKGI